MTHAQTCCIFSTVLVAWYLCVHGYTLANVCCQLKLCAARQMGWVGWVLGVCIIDRACTLCNHNRQVFPKIPRLARERLLFWCLPALGRSMDGYNHSVVQLRGSRWYAPSYFGQHVVLIRPRYYSLRSQYATIRNKEFVESNIRNIM